MFSTCTWRADWCYKNVTCPYCQNGDFDRNICWKKIFFLKLSVIFGTYRSDWYHYKISTYGTRYCDGMFYSGNYQRIHVVYFSFFIGTHWSKKATPPQTNYILLWFTWSTVMIKSDIILFFNQYCTERNERHTYTYDLSGSKILMTVTKKTVW